MKSIIGKVTSNKMNKSIVVEVLRRVPHPQYKKIITRKTKLYAHDEQNQCGPGDIVKIKSSRPRSKTKSWELEEILEKSA